MPMIRVCILGGSDWALGTFLSRRLIQSWNNRSLPHRGMVESSHLEMKCKSDWPRHCWCWQQSCLQVKDGLEPFRGHLQRVFQWFCQNTNEDWELYTTVLLFAQSHPLFFAWKFIPCLPVAASFLNVSQPFVPKTLWYTSSLLFEGSHLLGWSIFFFPV